MQYKTNQKIIIDRRKLEALFRLGCPDEAILYRLRTGKKFTTNDKLIDEILDAFMDVKEFNNWGGKRINSGKQSKKVNHLEKQDERQDEKQDARQLADIDIDIDTSNINNNIIISKKKENKIKEKRESQFDEFWTCYTPIKSSEGRFVSKGNKKACREKYIKLLNEGTSNETIINGLKQYLTYCRNNGYPSCGAEVFLNQRRFENDYSGNGCIQGQNPTSAGKRGISIVDVARQFVSEAKDPDGDCFF